MDVTVKIIKDTARLEVKTQGLEQLGQRNLRAMVESTDLLEPAEILVRNLSSHFSEADIKLVDEATISYGFLTLKLVPKVDGSWDLWEYRISPAHEEGWREGVTQTLQFWHGFHELCESLGAEWAPPHGAHYGFISDGVLEGRLPVEGVRFNSLAPDSGWVFTTDLYNGKVETLRKVHLYHLIQAQPGLGRVVGLPKGYYFRIGPDQESSGIWYDQSIALASPR